MPLVNIHLVRGRRRQEVRTLADAVHAAIVEALAVPERDRYQLIHQHGADDIIIEDTGLGIDRSEDAVMIQIVSRARDTASKQRLYQLLAANLERHCGIPPSDLVVTVIENSDDDWSFGHGRAQFLTGELT